VLLPSNTTLVIHDELFCFWEHNYIPELSGGLCQIVQDQFHIQVNLQYN
jgi:hypothetical protein